MSKTRGTILVLDDRESHGQQLIDKLSGRYERHGYYFNLVGQPNDAIDLIKNGGVIVVIAAYRLKEINPVQKQATFFSDNRSNFKNGYDFLEYIDKIKPETEKILYTDEGGIEIPTSAIRRPVMSSISRKKTLRALYESLDAKLARHERLVERKTGEGKGKNVLLTGGTGFLGDLLIKTYLQRTDCNLWILSRPKNGFSAEDRILNRVNPEDHDRIRILEGDLGCHYDDRGNDISACLGLDDINNKPVYRDFLEMTEVVDEVFHNGSYLSLKNNPEERQKCMDINLMGTQRLFNLMGWFKKGLEVFHYTSTVFVHGILSTPEVFYEDESLPNRWLNPYEESKWRAEVLVRSSGYPFRIFRPGVIIKEMGADILSSHTIYGVASLLESGYKSYKSKLSLIHI